MTGVVRERIDRDLSPPAVFRLAGGRAVLERGTRGWPETVVGVDPVASLRYARPDESAEGDPASDTGFDRLRDWLGAVGITLDGGEGGPDTNGVDPAGETATGAFGYLGYDLAAELETLPGTTTRDISLPDVAFDLYDTVVVVEADHLVVEAVEHDEQERPPGDRAADVADRLLTTTSEATAGDGRVAVRDLASNFTREEYVTAVERVKERIREGDTFQANVSQRLGFQTDAPAVALYEALRETNPAPYMGLLEYDDYAVVSTSPELLLGKDGRRLRTRPIAGTRPRGRDDADDAVLREELAASEKERAEHSILVDLARNDLGTVATHGSVTVDSFLEVEPYAAVQHLESVVSGELRAGLDVVHAVEAVFPGGTVTGAPKPRTLGIIDSVEPTERGPYTGSMGRIDFDGDATLNILIRTLVLDGDRGYIQVGGGVVHDSDPDDEYRETLQKATAMLAALSVDDDAPFETLGATLDATPETAAHDDESGITRDPGDRR